MASEAKVGAANLPDATELALDRTNLAHERTLMAWVRTAVSLISFGFTIYKFFQYMREQQPGEPIKRLLVSYPLATVIATLVSLLGILALLAIIFRQ